MSKTKDKTTKQDDRSLNILSVGESRTVEKVWLQRENKQVLQRQLDLNKLQDQAREEVIKEFDVLSKQQFVHVAKIVNYEYNKLEKRLTFSKEYFPENLNQFIERKVTQKGENLDFDQCLAFAGQILKGMTSLLTKLKRTHCNIKPENILIKDDCFYLDYDGHSESKIKRISRSKEKWIAPEFMDDGQVDRTRTDVFSLGLIILYMLDPKGFSSIKAKLNENEAELKRWLIGLKRNNSDDKNGVPLGFHYILSCMLSFDPYIRPNILELNDIFSETISEREFIAKSKMDNREMEQLIEQNRKLVRENKTLNNKAIELECLNLIQNEDMRNFRKRGEKNQKAEELLIQLKEKDISIKELSDEINKIKEGQNSREEKFKKQLKHSEDSIIDLQNKLIEKEGSLKNTMEILSEREKEIQELKYLMNSYRTKQNEEPPKIKEDNKFARLKLNDKAGDQLKHQKIVEKKVDSKNEGMQDNIEEMRRTTKTPNEDGFTSGKAPKKKNPEQSKLKDFLSQIELSSKIQAFFTGLKSEPNFNRDLNLISVKEPMPMTQGIREYKFNDILQTLILKLSEEIPVYRGVRGDGNCFYRSFGLLYLEYLLMSKEYDDHLCNIVETLMTDKYFFSVCNSRNDYSNKSSLVQDTFLQYLKLLIEYAQNNNETYPESVIQKLVDLTNKSENFDKGLVLLIRAFAQKAVEKIKKSREPEHEGLKSNMLILEKEISDIKVLGNEAEQIVVVLLSEYLNVKIVIHYLEKNQSKKTDPKILRDEHVPQKGKKHITIDLYFRPGHYDAGYNLQHSQKYYREIIREGEIIKDEKLRQTIEKKPDIVENQKKKCQYCTMEWDLDEFLFFPKCKHNEKCILCTVKEKDLTYKPDIKCSFKNCGQYLNFVDFQNAFKKFKEKKICNLCHIKANDPFEIENCGHMFCRDCKEDSYSISKKNCLFVSCKGKNVKEYPAKIRDSGIKLTGNALSTCYICYKKTATYNNNYLNDYKYSNCSRVYCAICIKSSARNKCTLCYKEIFLH